MSLLNPTLGEKLDRLCVLILKESRGAHFREELDKLLEDLEGTDLDFADVCRLMLTHVRLWDLTEEQMEFRYGAETDWKGAEILVALREFNAKRYALREEIDRCAGQFVGKEKVVL